MANKNPIWNPNNNRIRGRKVRIYWNLKRKCWSVLYNKILVYHAKTVSLKNAVFYVSEVRRQRVLKNRQKNVHAYVIGELVSLDKFKCVDLYNTKVSYNPYKFGWFYNVATGNKVESFDWVWCGDKILYGKNKRKEY